MLIFCKKLALTGSIMGLLAGCNMQEREYQKVATPFNAQSKIVSATPKPIQKKQQAKRPNPPKKFAVQYDRNLVRRYSIEKVENSSIGGVRRKTYRISVPSDIKEKQVRPTAQRIISRLVRKDDDLDEIALFLYSDAKPASGPYDVAAVDWAPSGEWGSTTIEVARTNDRAGYEISVKVKENLEAFLQQQNKPEAKLGMSEEKRREVFKELVAVEDRAQTETDQMYPIEVDVKTNIRKGRELQVQYKAEVRRQHGLSEEDAKKIVIEGATEQWPLQ